MTKITKESVGLVAFSTSGGIGQVKTHQNKNRAPRFFLVVLDKSRTIKTGTEHQGSFWRCWTSQDQSLQEQSPKVLLGGAGHQDQSLQEQSAKVLFGGAGHQDQSLQEQSTKVLFVMLDKSRPITTGTEHQGSFCDAGQIKTNHYRNRAPRFFL
jgi:hypothetical protein